MNVFEERLIERLESAYREVGENLTVVRNTVAATEAKNLPDIRARLALVINSLSTSAYEMQTMARDYGGYRDH